MKVQYWPNTTSHQSAWTPKGDLRFPLRVQTESALQKIMFTLGQLKWTEHPYFDLHTHATWTSRSATALILTASKSKYSRPILYTPYFSSDCMKAIKVKNELEVDVSSNYQKYIIQIA